MYLHFLNGELIPVVWNSVTNSGSGYYNYTMVNHQTEDFVLTAIAYYSGAMIPKLTMKDGMIYMFNSTASGSCWNGVNGATYCVSSITDRTGQNQLTLNYSNYAIATITDTIGRTASFRYNAAGYLANATYGGQTVKYGYSGNNLVTVTDNANRVTRFSYASQSNWLLSGVIYNTGGNSTYTFGSVPIGTDAMNYYVVRQNVAMPGSIVKSSSFSYNITDGEITYASVKQSDGQNVQGYTNYVFNAPLSSLTRTVQNATLVQMLSQRYWFDPETGRSVQQDVYSGTSMARSFYNRQSYDLWGNVIYNRDNAGHESYQSFTNTDTQWTLQGPGSLSTTSNGKQLYDDFLGPGLNSTAWTAGGSAASQTFTVANSLLNMTGKSSNYPNWSSMWVRSANTYSYPLYAEVQMALGQNPASSSEAAELVISPQLTPSNGDPFNNNDAVRVMLYDTPHYTIMKNIGGIQTQLWDGYAGGTWSVSWKVVLSDRNTLTVYLNRGWGGNGFVQVYANTTLGLSTSFTPSYVYLLYRTTRGNLYSVSFDYVGLTNSNAVTVNGLQAGQKVQLYDWNRNLQASGQSQRARRASALTPHRWSFPMTISRFMSSMVEMSNSHLPSEKSMGDQRTLTLSHSNQEEPVARLQGSSNPQPLTLMTLYPAGQHNTQMVEMHGSGEQARMHLWQAGRRAMSA